MEKHKQEPWFEDGNLILLSDDDIYFRIHRGVLARQSEVFQAMLEFPQPSDTDSQSGIEMMDGCQVVRMYDKAVELSNLLEAIYDGVTFQNRDIEDFFFLASILRLATKYLMNHLRTQAIEALTQTWAYTLEGHDAMVDRALKAPVGSEPTSLTYPYVHPLHVLNVARENHIRVIIPSVLYFLSVYPFSDLMHGNHPKLLAESRTGLTRPATTLSSEDMGNYTLMYQHRIELMLDFVRRFCGSRRSSMLCDNRRSSAQNAINVGPNPIGLGHPRLSTDESDPCGIAFARLASRASRSWYPRTGPLSWMLQVTQFLRQDASICKKCVSDFEMEMQSLREHIWRSLPGVVGLPQWGELIESDLPKDPGR